MSCTPPVMHSLCPAPLLSCIHYVLHPSYHAFFMSYAPPVMHSSCTASLQSYIPLALYPACRAFLMSCTPPVMHFSCPCAPPVVNSSCPASLCHVFLRSCIHTVKHFLKIFAKSWKQKCYPFLDNISFYIEQIRYRNETKNFQNVYILIERRIKTFTAETIFYS